MNALALTKRSGQQTAMVQYAIAGALVAVATPIAILLHAKLPEGAFATFLIAVVLATWAGGLRPGLFATFLAAISLDYFVLPPRYHFEPLDSQHLLRLATFTLVSIVVGALYQASHAARRRAEQALADESATREELARVAEDLRAANGAKDEFLGLVSHELKSPLTRIMLDAAVIRRGGSEAPPAHELLDDISQEAARLGRIIDSLLTLARRDDGISPDIEPVIVEKALREAVANHQRRWPERAIRLSVETERITMADPLQLAQVLENLLSNAEKYSSPERPIDVSADLEDDELVISVADCGPGISAEEAARIFSPFYRSEATADRAPGIGVGLAVCHRLVEAQSGRIWVAPRPGGGSQFSFTLPLAEEPESLITEQLLAKAR